MKQSNDNFMKQLQGIADAYKEVGAAEERERYFTTIGAIAGELKKLTDRMIALTLKMEARSEAAGPRPQPKKRKAVEASEADINLVHEWIANATAMGNPVLPKQLKNCGIGTRTIAAACRSLVESHVLEKVGAKGYRLVQRKENGWYETTLPSE